jgi:hypothetical protein
LVESSGNIGLTGWWRVLSRSEINELLFRLVLRVKNILVVTGTKKLVPLGRSKVGKILGLGGDGRKFLIEDNMKLRSDSTSL